MLNSYDLSEKKANSVNISNILKQSLTNYLELEKKKKYRDKIKGLSSMKNIQC